MKNSEKVAGIIDNNVRRITELIVEYERTVELIQNGDKNISLDEADYQIIIDRCDFGIKLLTAVNKDIATFHAFLVKDGH